MCTIYKDWDINTQNNPRLENVFRPCWAMLFKTSAWSVCGAPLGSTQHRASPQSSPTYSGSLFPSNTIRVELVFIDKWDGSASALLPLSDQAKEAHAFAGNRTMPGWDLASATRRGERARGQTLSSGEVRNVAGGIKYQLIGISNGRRFRDSRFSPVCVVVETGRMGHAWFRCRLGTQDGCILVMYWIFHVRLTDWKVGGIVEVPVGGVLKVSRDDKG